MICLRKKTTGPYKNKQTGGYSHSISMQGLLNLGPVPVYPVNKQSELPTGSNLSGSYLKITNICDTNVHDCVRILFANVLLKFA